MWSSINPRLTSLRGPHRCYHLGSACSWWDPQHLFPLLSTAFSTTSTGAHQDQSHPFHQHQVYLWCHQEVRTPRSIHAQPETNSHQFCLALLWPHLLHSLLKTLCVPSEVMIHPQSEKWKCSSISCVRLFVTPWTVARQAPLSMGSPRQEYWSELPFPSPGSLPDSGDQAHVTYIGRWVLYHWATRETPNVRLGNLKIPFHGCLSVIPGFIYVSGYLIHFKVPN